MSLRLKSSEADVLIEDVLRLEPRRRTSLRVLLFFFALSALFIGLTHIPPTVIFWLGALSLPVFAFLQIVASAMYLKLMPAAYERMSRLGARRLVSYLQDRLQKAYHRLMDDTKVVVVLFVLNAAIAVILLFDASLIPIALWEWLSFFAFGSALFIFYVALRSSKIILEMFQILLKRNV